jgi:hypothetical protein
MRAGCGGAQAQTVYGVLTALSGKGGRASIAADSSECLSIASNYLGNQRHSMLRFTAP